MAITPMNVREQNENEPNYVYEAYLRKERRKFYHLAICPDCDGDGYFDVVTNLTYDGAVWTRKETCETCEGSGELDQEEYDKLMLKREGWREGEYEEDDDSAYNFSD